MRRAVNTFSWQKLRAGLQSGARRGAGCADGMYAEFKGTPAERSKGRKVSLAEQGRLLAWSGPTGLGLTPTARASLLVPECVQVEAHGTRLLFFRMRMKYLHATMCMCASCVPARTRACSHK